MIQQIFILTFLLTSVLTVFGQDTTAIPYMGLYLVKENSGITSDIGDCLICNPEIMNDRIILDSNKTMISRKKSNPWGYTYSEWKNENYDKSYEEIKLRLLKIINFFSDKGEILEQRIESSAPFIVRYAENSLKTVSKVQIQITPNEADSLINTYQIPNEKIWNGTKFWAEFNFYDNGSIESTGIIISGINEKQANIYKIGTWLYYDFTGHENEKEEITKIKKQER